MHVIQVPIIALTIQMKAVRLLQDGSLDKYCAGDGMVAPELIIRYTVFEEAAPEG